MSEFEGEVTNGGVAAQLRRWHEPGRPREGESELLRGFVPTPPEVVDLMVGLLFDGKPPSADSQLLDPGCGPGAFLEGVNRWCAEQQRPKPRMLGVELSRARSAAAAAKFAKSRSISIVAEDFLLPSDRSFDFVIGNPPYVSIGGLSEAAKARYRDSYKTARGRFDLYLLFFEQALRLLKPGGRLVFITPEKFLYVNAAAEFRRMLSKLDVREIRLVSEATFEGRVTYPAITVIDKSPASGPFRMLLRDGTSRSIAFPDDGSSLLPRMNGQTHAQHRLTLGDVCVRVSCGVATGADDVFVQPRAGLMAGLAKFAYPTVSGRQLVPGSVEVKARDAMLIPYDDTGELMEFGSLGAFGTFLAPHKMRLTRRVCTNRKPWFAFHDSVPLLDMLRPKILCKDIAARPGFWVDREGVLVPRHSVYYIVPRDPGNLDALAEYLRSAEACAWLEANCQRAANGFFRFQSSVLKRLPVPAELGGGSEPRDLGTRRSAVPRTVRLIAPSIGRR